MRRSPGAAASREQPQYDREERSVLPLLEWPGAGLALASLVSRCLYPTETSVRFGHVLTTIANLIESVSFQREPNSYLRGAGSELPFFKAFPDREALDDRTGTWELLFQQARDDILNSS